MPGRFYSLYVGNLEECGLAGFLCVEEVINFGGFRAVYSGEVFLGLMLACAVVFGGLGVLYV